MLRNHADRILATVKGAAREEVNPVVTSWRRCIESYGLSPHRLPRPTVLSTAQLADFRRPIDDLVAIARDEVDRLFLRLRDHGYLVTLADRGGVTLLMRCAENQLDVCRSASLLVGSVWDEESQGTNGVGTCVKEARPVSVVMDEHFSINLVNLTCTVAPIFGDSKHVASVLNVTTDRPTDHNMQAIVRDIVLRSARRIENLYFERRHAARRVLRVSRHSDFNDIAWEERIAVGEDGRVVDVTPGMLRMFDGAGIRHGDAGRPLHEVLSGAQDLRTDGDAITSCIGVNGTKFFIRPREDERPRPVRRPDGAEASPRVGMRTSPDGVIDTLFGHDLAMIERVRVAQKLINRRLPVLLQGETGTGKSSLAKLLHQQSAHGSGAFVSLNCAAIPPDLIESELFGYRPGAFTGASKNGSKGRLLDANGGTLFLDEIGDMPPPLQTRFLHVLSDGEFTPVGGSQPVRVQMAVISASLHDIAAMVRAGRFREDLYFRLNGATLKLPPLRHRPDRRALIQAVFRDEADQLKLADLRIDPAVMRILEAYHWPGNVRELRHVARYTVTLAETGFISADLLPPPFDGTGGGDEGGQRETLDRRLLQLALDQSKWNVSIAAKKLGMSRTTLHRKMRALSIRRAGDN
jgi:sigma-54 dependent transcriptional regulator, acetoin dehydrogenase operon transcriptional activator AcoR